MNLKVNVKKMSINKKVIITVAIILLVIVVISLSTFFGRKKSTEPAYKRVQLIRENLEITILSTGVVQSENRLDIKPPIAGRADRVLVKEGQEVKKGQILAWMSSTERAALIDSARSKGAHELKKWEAFYRATPILAPINGTIILKNVEPGQTLTNQDSLLVMSDRLTIKAQVDETDISQIKTKQKAQVILDAYPKQTIRAYVDQIAYDAKTVNSVTTYIVDVLPDKNQVPDFFRSGMTANVIFFVASKQNVLTLPSEAVKAKDGKFYVLTTTASNKMNDSNGEASNYNNGTEQPVQKFIEIGISDGKRLEILSGLNENDTVLIPQIKTSTEKKGINPFSPIRARKPKES